MLKITKRIVDYKVYKMKTKGDVGNSWLNHV